MYLSTLFMCLLYLCVSTFGRGARIVFPCCLELFFVLRQSEFRAARNFGDCSNEIMWRYKKSQIILYQFSMVN